MSAWSSSVTNLASLDTQGDSSAPPSPPKENQPNEEVENVPPPPPPPQPATECLSVKIPPIEDGCFCTPPKLVKTDSIATTASSTLSSSQTFKSPDTCSEEEGEEPANLSVTTTCSSVQRRRWSHWRETARSIPDSADPLDDTTLDDLDQEEGDTSAVALGAKTLVDNEEGGGHVSPGLLGSITTSLSSLSDAEKGGASPSPTQ